ncbi:hypothetical protein [Scytonema hofmannii]|nr:hypothetical protein [Scytonema hofmannii]
MKSLREEVDKVELFVSQAKRETVSEREQQIHDGYLAEIGVKDVSKMKEVDIDKLVQNLASGECSQEYVMNLAYYIAAHAPSSVAGKFLYSDLDGDGVPLIEEIGRGTDPFAYDEPKQQKVVAVHNKTSDLEL